MAPLNARRFFGGLLTVFVVAPTACERGPAHSRPAAPACRSVEGRLWNQREWFPRCGESGVSRPAEEIAAISDAERALSSPSQTVHDQRSTALAHLLLGNASEAIRMLGRAP